MSFAMGEIAAILKVDIKAFILMSIFIVIFCKIRKISLIFAAIMILFAVIANIRYEAYEGSINRWNKCKDGTRMSIEGEVDDFIEKENVAYIYIDEIFVFIYKDNLHNDIKPGNYVKVSGEKASFQKARNFGNYDEEKYYNSLGFTKKINASEIEILDSKKNLLKELLGKIKSSYIESLKKVWDKEYVDLISAITVGYKEGLSDDIKDRYRIMGISHLLAISGLHLSIIGTGVFKLLRKRFRYGFSGIAAIFIIIVFGIITGAGPSILRAVIMFVIGIMAKISGRSYDMTSSISIAGLVLMLNCPYVIYNAGFLLSFGAIAAICIISGISSNVVAVTTFIQIFTIPLTMYLFFEIPVYSVIINIILLPLMPIILVLGLFTGIAGMVWIDLGKSMAYIGESLFWIFEKIGEIAEGLPHNMIITGKPDISKIIVYYIAIIIMCILMYYYKNILIGCIIILPVLVLVFGNIDKEFVVTSLDVGQGDCTIINNRGLVYMIDAGSSDIKDVYKYRIKSHLKARGIERIEAIILTHMDKDHISAVTNLIDDKVVKKIIMPDIGKKDDEYIEICNYAAAKGIEVEYISSGKCIIDKNMELLCLYPYKGATGDNKNELSTVIKLDYKNCSVMFMGDLGEEGEREIIKEVIKCDVIKAGHHGSKYSSSEDFLEAVDADYAIISSGVDNRYGHPDIETLNRFENFGIKYYMTKKSGQIDLHIEDEGYFFITRID